MHSVALKEFLANIPQIIWVFCALLLVAFIFPLLRMCAQGRRLKLQFRQFVKAVQESGKGKTNVKNGLDLADVDRLRVRFAKLSGPKLMWWRTVDESIVAYTSPEDREGWFTSDAAQILLPYESVVVGNFNSALFGSIPGILTGLGLMGTFIAILLALYGVRYSEDPVNPVSGMQGLINGLSGKFLTSIIALILSILFTLIERKTLRDVRLAYDEFIREISESLPHLRPTRILLDIQRFSAKQTVSVSNISSEVVDRFTNAFNDQVTPALAEGMSSGVARSLQTEFRPTMEQMAGSLGSLQSAIVHLESQKQDSVTGEFARMTQSLEQAISRSLLKMGEDFHAALSGSARQEFGNVQSTLESTRHVLTEMSAQFAQMQTALGQIIRTAEDTTTGQLKAGKEQVESLTALMHGLMVRLQQTAEQNISNIQGHLTRVVSDLTEKVTGLSVDMMDAVSDMAKRSQQSVGQIIEKTDAWSEANAKRLEMLLSSIEIRSSEFQQASVSLLEAKAFVTNLLAQNAGVLAQMADASRAVQAYSTGLSGQTEGLKALTSNYSIIANHLRETSTGVHAAFERHEQLLTQHKETLTQYHAVVERLHEPIGNIMKATSEGLRDYNQSVERNFTKIVEIADQLVPKAANLLSGQIEDLGAQLEELGDVISKATEKANARAAR